MCTVMAGIAAIGGLMQYRAARQQAKAESAYYSAMAEQNATNAKIAEQRRSQISDRYLQQQKQLDDRRRLIIAQHAADAGASGLTNSGSVLDADSAAYDQWKESSMNLLWNQRVDTHDAWANQANYMNQASANRASAANARSQGRLSALSTLIGTASSVYTGLRDYAGTKAAGDTSLHHSPTRLTIPETMEDQVFGMNGNSYKSKPLTYGAKNDPYGWLRR
jgi:hypothetical protein|nr:MAG TPA: hypothetical protein [Caudoviricetes sp.]